MRTCADRADLAGDASWGAEATARGDGEEERGEMPDSQRDETGRRRWPMAEIMALGGVGVGGWEPVKLIGRGRKKTPSGKTRATRSASRSPGA